MNVSQTKKLLLSVLLVALLTVGVWGAVSSGMMMQDGTMQNCPFMGVTALCDMGALEHLTAWQSMFAALPTNAASALLLLILLALVLLVRVVGRLPFKVEINWQAIRQKLYAKHLLASSYAHPLQEAFSQGILNPKVY